MENSGSPASLGYSMENSGSPAPLEKRILPLLLDSLLIPQFNTNQYHFVRHLLRSDIHVQVHLP
jgi:hypothetical protein